MLTITTPGAETAAAINCPLTVTVSPTRRDWHSYDVRVGECETSASVGVYKPDSRLPALNVCVPVNVASLTVPVAAVPLSLSRSEAMNADR